MAWSSLSARSIASLRVLVLPAHSPSPAGCPGSSSPSLWRCSNLPFILPRLPAEPVCPGPRRRDWPRHGALCAFPAARGHVAFVSGSHASLTTQASRPRLRPRAVLVPLPVGPPGCPRPPVALAVCVFVGAGGESTSDPWFGLGRTAPVADGAVGAVRKHIRGRGRRGGDYPPCRRPAPLQVFPRRGELTCGAAKTFLEGNQASGQRALGAKLCRHFHSHPRLRAHGPVPGSLAHHLRREAGGLLWKRGGSCRGWSLKGRCGRKAFLRLRSHFLSVVNGPQGSLTSSSIFFIYLLYFY